MIKRFFTGLRDWSDRHWVEFLCFGAISLLLLFVLWPLIVHSVPAGHVGVLWYRFMGGTVTDPDRIRGEGLHIIWPWDKIYIYDARLQRIDENLTGLSVDGLNVSITVASRFSIEGPYAGYLHKSIGPDYREKLIQPELRALVLSYIAEHEAEDLYSQRRTEVQAIIQTRLQGSFNNISTNVAFDESYIRVEDVLIEEIHLPDFIKRAIQEKERTRHIAEAYDYRLLIEDKERERKRIEAEGIRSFQEIINPGITPSYLRWRGIEATLELAQSNNAKLVIIGGSEDGLPLILNTGDTLPGTTAPLTSDFSADAMRNRLSLGEQTSAGETVGDNDFFGASDWPGDIGQSSQTAPAANRPEDMGNPATAGDDPPSPGSKPVQEETERSLAR